jgi:type III secretory pathway component EscR
MSFALLSSAVVLASSAAPTTTTNSATPAALLALVPAFAVLALPLAFNAIGALLVLTIRLS